MEVTVKKDTRGYTRIKGGAEYSGVKTRTFRKWLKRGLPYIRTPTGSIVVAYADIDRYLAKGRTTEDTIGEHVDQIFSELAK